ncbi:uncharacterized protein LOC127814292 isoform X2 [Diospyros lotus]|nr:uncharacterized protein LOC127814292 isoform X2 [Diospyros lotus]XP_052169829.1 uncharacterized protein LOC127814292 isoform X2 [Diospyros lotus]XP_052169830.1 uncharacterized protein LOC127814292 isoform X2 [Diospyros lotus]
MEEHHRPLPKVQIYPTSSNEISTFWREKYERDAKKYWDIFYKRHQDRFFKDRHYLDKEWGFYFSSGSKGNVILEVGCGAGNTIFPLIATYQDIFIHACDFSPRAINLVKDKNTGLVLLRGQLRDGLYQLVPVFGQATSIPEHFAHKDFNGNRVNAFVCDLTTDDLSKQISPSSVDIVTMIFVLSAVSPEKMSQVIQNVRKVLKPNGYVLFRDYATGDLAQERFSCKDQKISENFYVRGDGTRAFYFSDEFLISLFKENGFDIEEHGLCCKQVENRSREIVMNRRWVQAVFQLHDPNSLSDTKPGNEIEPFCNRGRMADVKEDTFQESVNDNEIDMSEGIAVQMFGISFSDDEIIEVKLRDRIFKLKVLPREYQHTCKSTGLMLWDSARLMASVIVENPAVVAGKRVLELGCGCGGICSMVAARSANLVVATDGDARALDLLTQNVALNLEAPSLNKLTIKRLEWGNRNHIESIKNLNHRGFDIIFGTDITYIPETILPLFATAKELISSDKGTGEKCEPALILCHILRRVDEPSILSAASQNGFRLVDKWPAQIGPSQSRNIISSWFSENGPADIPSTALNIMYFHNTVK